MYEAHHYVGTVALVMAALIVASAMPVLAAPSRFVYECQAPDGTLIFSGNGGERPIGRDEIHPLKEFCTDRGGAFTFTVIPQPGKPI
jgi:hypothetical protein